MIEVHGYPIFDGNGNVVQMIEHGLDITERRQLEDEIKSKLHDLERFQKVTMGRENRILELKEEVKRLKGELEGRKL